MHPPTGSSDFSSECGRSINLAKKLTRYVSHLFFLQTCMCENITPKGFRLKFGFTALPKSDTLHTTIHNIIASAEKAIIIECVQTYERETVVLRKQLEQNKLRVNKYFSLSQYCQYNKNVNDKTRNLERLFLNRKKRKCRP
eukprot:TRINITY_DN12042_c0_g1_i20.p1 TRINITY_DN12042_c0_g1~~TRINITY_DN12042_c0_g1_i20.p1  ORF type:complete len:141 (+),score=12.83 TRINITY_DN12042_c0_g1_i20:53-475(+)